MLLFCSTCLYLLFVTHQHTFLFLYPTPIFCISLKIRLIVLQCNRIITIHWFENVTIIYTLPWKVFKVENLTWRFSHPSQHVAAYYQHVIAAICFCDDGTLLLEVCSEVTQQEERWKCPVHPQLSCFGSASKNILIIHLQ